MIDSTEEEQWCDAGNTKKQFDEAWDHNNLKSKLECVILDFSGVNGMDASGLQTLIDLRRDVVKFAGNDVPFYFVNIRSDLRRNLEYFETLFRPVPLVPSNGYEPSNEQEVEEWVELYATKDVYCQQFFCDTIDEAIANAHKKFQRESTSTLHSASIEV